MKAIRGKPHYDNEDRGKPDEECKCCHKNKIAYKTGAASLYLADACPFLLHLAVFAATLKITPGRRALRADVESGEAGLMSHTPRFSKRDEEKAAPRMFSRSIFGAPISWTRFRGSRSARIPPSLLSFDAIRPTERGLPWACLESHRRPSTFLTASSIVSIFFEA